MPKTLQHKVSFRSWGVAKALVKRAEQHAGCPVIVVTVDRVAGRNRETLARLRRTDPRQCASCHEPVFRAGHHATVRRTHRQRAHAGLRAQGDLRRLEWRAQYNRATVETLQTARGDAHACRPGDGM